MKTTLVRPKMTKRPLKLGLVGLGHWGRNISRTVSRLKNIDLVAVCSSNPEAASFLPSGCSIFPDWIRLLEETDIDGVLLAVPPDIQSEIALECIRRNVPVFLEKPLATNLEDAERICKAVGKTKCPVLVDHIYTFHPGFRKLKQLIKESGAINSFHSTGGNTGPVRSGISPLWDWAPHDVSMCLSVMGGIPTKIEATASAVVESSNGTSANYTVRMDFDNNAVAELNFGNAMERRIREVRVETSVANFTFTDAQPWILQTCSDGKTKQLPYRRERALSNAIRSFTNKIKNNTDGSLQLKNSLNVVSTIARIERALQSTTTGE